MCADQEKAENVTEILTHEPVVKALCYKQEGRRFVTQWGDFFKIYLILPIALGPGFHSASNINEYQKQK
jgi:hypothetical protein